MAVAFFVVIVDGARGQRSSDRTACGGTADPVLLHDGCNESTRTAYEPLFERCPPAPSINKP